jgi:hypothetical protein
MANFVNEILERMKGLEAEIQALQKKRDDLDREQKELDRLLEACRLLLDHESRHDSLSAFKVYVSSNGLSKWAGVPITKAIAQLLEDNPDWKRLDRKKMFAKVRNQLLQDNYDFAGKTPSFSVNVALSKVVQPTKMTKN